MSPGVLKATWTVAPAFACQCIHARSVPALGHQHHLPHPNTLSLQSLQKCLAAQQASMIVALANAFHTPLASTVLGLSLRSHHPLRLHHLQIQWFQNPRKFLVAQQASMIVALASVFHSPLASIVLGFSLQPYLHPVLHQHHLRMEDHHRCQVALPDSMIVAAADVCHPAPASGVPACEPKP